MSDPFSDDVPTEKGVPRSAPKSVLGERFVPWVEQGFKKGRRREARPMMRVVALLVIIVCLAWSAQQPGTLKSAILASEHPRALLPIGIAAGDAPVWNEDNLRASIDTVQPLARQCLQGWSDMSLNDEGMVVVEVVLTPEGPDEAAIYDQLVPVPKGIQSCLGGALGSLTWPAPPDVQSVHFPIVGG
jgi:hypothetical protein